MKTKLATVLCILVTISVCSALSLPSSFKKCNVKRANFNQCLTEAIRDAVRQLDKPMPKYGLPVMDPFAVPYELGIVEFGDAQTGVHQKYTNFVLKGLTNIRDAKASMDFTSDILSLELNYDQIITETNFEAEGKLIFLPISTNSTNTVTLEKPTFKFIFNMEKYQKDGQLYYRVVKTQAAITANDASFYYKNLTKNQHLTDVMNKEMTIYGKEIFRQIGLQYQALYSVWFMQPFSNFLEKVPISEIFENV
ncbi:uncharacterized protein LOC135138690 [Zophobas morio]|uniref:uncharacterized protein LOC135138690 n=1 Tax=Zophobas morio TaxID=2755281 RepID=UPI0030832B85